MSDDITEVQPEVVLDPLLEIEKQLQERASLLEKQRIAAHEAAMKEIADARAAEEARQRRSQAIIAEQDQLILEKKIAGQKAQEALAREERELQRLREQEQNKAQAEVEAVVARKEALSKKLADIEHQEELAKKELRDLILRNANPVDAERIMPNPLDRFLQKEPM
jgi:hypothetical protein